MSFLKKHYVNLFLVVALTFVFIFLLFHNFFKNPFYYFASDNSEIYFPSWVFIKTALRSFQFPLLNSFWFGGSLPFAATESSVFYTPYMLLNILMVNINSLNTAYLYYFYLEILHYFIASIGFYFLLKDGLKLNSFSSIFGAIIYACSGSMIGRFVHVIVIFTLAWLPYLYWSYLKFSETRKLIYATGVILSLIFIITGSHPQFTYYVFIFFGLFILYTTITIQKKERLYIFVYSVVLVVLACLLSAPKLLLTYELSQNIVHSTLETSIKNLYNSLHPLYFLTLLVPYLFGRHQIGYWGSEYPWGNWENFIYIGIIPFFLFIFALSYKNKKYLFLFLLNLVIAVFFLLGKYNVVSIFMNQKLPLSQSISMISKMTFMFHFFLSVLVAIGIHIFWEQKNKRNTYIMLFVVTAIFIFTLFYLKNNFDLLLPSNRPIPTPLAKEFASKNIFVTFLLFGGGAAIIWLSVLLRRKKILYVLILVYMADIFINGGFFNPIDSAPSSPDSYFGTNTTISKIKEDPDVFRVHSLNPRNINMIQSVESTYGYHTIETKAYHFVVPYLENSNILDLLNVKYALSAPTPPSRFIQLQPSLWLNTSFLNRVSFIPSYRLVDQVEQIVPVLTSQTFEPKKEVVIQNTDTNTKALQDFNIPLNKNNVSRATPNY